MTPIADAPNSRFLLTPALYPARLGNRGSGTDPDLYARAGNVTPVNESLPMFPLSPALGRYLRDGSTEGLGALSVTNVFARPWLQTDPSIRWQLALPMPRWLGRSATTSETVRRVTPELSLGTFPAIGTLASNVGAGNVLFGDAREASGAGVPAAWRAFGPVRAVTPANVFVRAADGWVDARLAFVEDPELAQTYGGAVTTNSGATLDVDPNAYALVLARGRLVAAPSGVPLATNTAGFRWIFLPKGVRAVRCSGLCVVAVQAVRVPDVPLNPPQRPSAAVDFAAPVPWFVTTTLRAGTDPFLRYNVTYDEKWIALYRNALLPHVRVDGAVNGWLVPPRTSGERVVLLESGAAAIALAEIVSVALVAFLLYGCFASPAHSSTVRPRVEATRAVRTETTANSESTT